ncbi:MAG: prepilin-type N-terminal cleavage/methylation domain-containing protein [Nitrospirae bacterium]|nr:prepilin-type N-terminal cleavage/methylation domain-containing protein [Nitrospirota bacterium]
MANVLLNKDKRCITHPAQEGFTLVEVLVSMLILTAVSLGLLQTMMYSMSSNVKNTLREMAVTVTQEEMDKLRGLAKTADLSLVQTGSSTYNVTRRYKNMDFQYTVAKNVWTTAGNSRGADITVTWSYQGQNFSHHSRTYIRPL